MNKLIILLAFLLAALLMIGMMADLAVAHGGIPDFPELPDEELPEEELPEPMPTVPPEEEPELVPEPKPTPDEDDEEDYEDDDTEVEEYEPVTPVSVSSTKKSNSCPSLGLSFEGSVYGDMMPTLYTYKLNGERITSITMPLYADGGVIVTPARVAGETLKPATNFDDRRMQWYENHAK